jgi:hypothetical protein
MVLKTLQPEMILLENMYPRARLYHSTKTYVIIFLEIVHGKNNINHLIKHSLFHS